MVKLAELLRLYHITTDNFPFLHATGHESEARRKTIECIFIFSVAHIKKFNFYFRGSYQDIVHNADDREMRFRVYNSRSFESKVLLNQVTSYHVIYLTIALAFDFNGLDASDN